MKQITKFLALFALVFTTSCNVDSPVSNLISDFGVITLRTADKQYYIDTDENGLIFSSQTYIAIKDTDVGRRVRVEFTVITESFLGDNVTISNMGYTPLDDIYLLSEINSWEEKDRDIFYDTVAGATAMKYSSVIYSENKGYLNFIFQTLTNQSDYSPNGNSTLILDDTTESDTTKYLWHYRAKGDPKNLTLTYASFRVYQLMQPDKLKYPIQIKYKDIGTGEDTILKFEIDLTPSAEPEQRITQQ